MKPFKAYLNVLNLRINMALKRSVIKNYPIVAYIEPTTFCNLRCPACPTGLRLGIRTAASINVDFYKAIIDEIGEYIFQLFMYNWGEPLLHKQTSELIEYAKSKCINVSLSTNLSMKLDDAYIERLVKSGLDILIVSLDGATKETYEKYRRGGDYALVRENMARIHAAKLRLGTDTPSVICQFLVFQHNEHEIDLITEKYKEWGADILSLAGAQMPSGPYTEGFAPSTLAKYNIYHPDHIYQLETKQQLRSRRSCSWLYGSVVVNPNAKVSPCCSVPAEADDFGEYSPGSGFFDVWNSEKYRNSRTFFRNPKRRNRSAQKSPETVEGMGVSLERPVDQLVCQRCPIPFRQNDVSKMIRSLTKSTVFLLLHTANIRYLKALLPLSIAYLIERLAPS